MRGLDLISEQLEKLYKSIYAPRDCKNCGEVVAVRVVMLNDSLRFKIDRGTLSYSYEGTIVCSKCNSKIGVSS